MKKISILIVLILCVTIGGVYATWYYSGAENVADVTESITINLESSETVGSHGAYTLTKNLNGAASFIRIDQVSDNHLAGLVYAGSMTLTFTPAVHASAEIKNGQFDTWVYFSTNLPTFTYGEKQIFNNFTHVSKDTGIKVTWVKGADGKLTCDLTEYIKSEITLANEFFLDTLADYNAFSEVISPASITIHVTDGIVETA